MVEALPGDLSGLSGCSGFVQMTTGSWKISTKQVVVPRQGSCSANFSITCPCILAFEGSG